MSIRRLAIFASFILLPCGLGAQSNGETGYTAAQCANCATWNTPHDPVKLYGNTYWVGTEGLGVILIASETGHILIDGALPDSPQLIEANIQALGFRLADVRLIVNTHTHFDHAGGIAALQRSSGAKVAATNLSAQALRTGRPVANDPQHNDLLPFPTVANVDVVGDGDTLRVGSLAIIAHLTPGHSPGGTSWSWRSCEGDRCLNMVYADSQTPVSSDGFRFSDGNASAEFERGLAIIEGLPCDVLMTPHPGASKLWERLASRSAGHSDALLDHDACRRYAAQARDQLSKRIARERGRR